MNTRARTKGGFTLLELLVVIGIIGLLASMGVGALRGFNAVNIVAAGNRQLLDDISMARNHAQNERTTVYMVFVPGISNLFNLPDTPEDRKRLTNRISGQFTSYNFLVKRSSGDQPGRGRARYLTDWKSLPNGAYLSENELHRFTTAEWIANVVPRGGEPLSGTNLPLPYMLVPFPRASSTNEVFMPCIAFNYRGELLGPDEETPRRIDEYIRLTRGSIIYPTDANDKPIFTQLPEMIETPRGNYTNNPYVRIDWITGRARIEEPKI